MSKELFYYRCLLRKSNGDYITTWLPEKFAKRNKIIEIKQDGEWSNGWRVFNVYKDIKKSQEEIKIDAETYKHHREITDI